MIAAKKVGEASATNKVAGTDAGFVHSLQSPAKQRTLWPWPRAALTIILLSLLLWGGVAAIALLAFN